MTRLQHVSLLRGIEESQTYAIFDTSFVAPLPGADLPTMKNQNREVEQKRNKEWEGKVPPGHAFTGATEHCWS